MMKRSTSIPLLALALAVSGCAATTPPPQGPSRDGTVTVGLGGHARIGRVVLTPVRIEEDSRCPTGVQCVWAGRVRVAVSVNDNDGSPAHPVVMTLGEPLAIQDGGEVTIVAVCPHPVHPNPVRREDYRITFARGAVAPSGAASSGCRP